MCDGPIIQKLRRIIDYKGFKWEIDEFYGDNAELVVAEIELLDESQVFEKPSWLGDEVTYDARYFNSNLAVHPYGSW